MVHRSFTPIQTLEELKAEIQSWIRSKGYCDGSPLPYFKRIIEQFHLQSQVDIYDLVNELYLRGVKQLETKGPIEKPRPWFRSAAYNVARELSRSSRRYIQITPADENELASEELDENQISDSDRLALRESIQTLASKDRLILTWKIVDELTWREIGERLILAGEKPQTETALRQRGHRALKNLRKLYKRHLVEPIT